MTEKQAIKDSIAHWERMISAVRKMSKDEREGYPTWGEMRDMIGEDWGAKCCALCRKYRRIQLCHGCPYYKKYRECGEQKGARNAWYQVQLSDTWRGWLLAANKVKRQLKSLL